MTICGAMHVEIAFDGKNCPMCEVLEENKGLRHQIILEAEPGDEPLELEDEE